MVKQQPDKVVDNQERLQTVFRIYGDLANHILTFARDIQVRHQRPPEPHGGRNRNSRKASAEEAFGPRIEQPVRGPEALALSSVASFPLQLCQVEGS